MISRRYMSDHPRPFMGLLSAVAENNFHTLINDRLVSQWRETLAMLVAYVNDTDSWVSLCNELGMKLAQARKEHAATLCFICAGNVDRAVALWMRSKKATTITAMQVCNLKLTLAKYPVVALVFSPLYIEVLFRNIVESVSSYVALSLLTFRLIDSGCYGEGYCARYGHTSPIC